MKIVGPIKDYYDVSMQHGIDTDLIFVRTPSTINVIKSKPQFTVHEQLFSKLLLINTQRWSSVPILPTFFEKNNSVCSSRQFVVGFCGKAYYGMELTVNSNQQSITYYIYDYEHFEQIIELHPEIKKENNNWPKWMMRSWEDTQPLIKQYFKNSGDKDYVADYLNEQKIAYFIIWPMDKNTGYICEIEHHPLLKRINFSKIVDPFTAYQEISMFIGNIPKDPNMMVTLTDKEELFKKGFYEMSFKKEPTKRRK